MPSPIDPAFMARAIELAKQGYPAPNPHVGCVLELDGKIVGEGYHHHAGGPHAEVAALLDAGDKARGATAYVTQEPCNHQGRTGPCSLALIEAGVARVIVATLDPNPKASGGIQRLRDAGIEVMTGVMTEEAEQANAAWLAAVRRQRPFVVCKAAISLDGRTALSNGQSKWITGEESRRQGHILRAECGAVLVGRRTVEQDDPELTVRHIEVVNQPLRIVLDRERKLNLSMKVFNEAAPYLRVVETLKNSNELEASVKDGAFQLEDVLSKLYAIGITGLLVEGGAATLSGFMSQGLVDRLELFVAPKVLGSGPAWTLFEGIDQIENASQWRFESVKPLGPDMWITARPSLTK